VLCVRNTFIDTMQRPLPLKRILTDPGLRGGFVNPLATVPIPLDIPPFSAAADARRPSGTLECPVAAAVADVINSKEPHCEKCKQVVLPVQKVISMLPRIGGEGTRPLDDPALLSKEERNGVKHCHACCMDSWDNHLRGCMYWFPGGKGCRRGVECKFCHILPCGGADSKHRCCHNHFNNGEERAGTRPLDDPAMSARNEVTFIDNRCSKSWESRSKGKCKPCIHWCRKRSDCKSCLLGHVAVPTPHSSIAVSSVQGAT